jgi:hypothetical protein
MSYRRLAELDALERELIEAGNWTELAALGEERSLVVAGLPPVPPPEARELIEASRRAVAENAAALTAQLTHVYEELAALGRRRRAATRYDGAGARPLLDARG